MLDNLVAERVEKWKNKALFERKSSTLRELNKELEQETRELDMLVKKKKDLYASSGKDETQDDHDAEDFSLNSTCDANEGIEDVERRSARLAIRQQIRESEGTIDSITRDLDLLNTDLEDLAQQLNTTELAACTGTPFKGKKGATPLSSAPSTVTENWEDIGREIIVNFSLPQCQTLLWDQIGEKASLLELIRAGQFDQQEAEEAARSATSMADNVSRQLSFAKADLQSRLHRAEKQRVQDVWALLRAQSKEAGSESALSECDEANATRVAIQRAQDLESEVEVLVISDAKHSKLNEEKTQRITALEAELLKIQLRSNLSLASSHGASDAEECFDSLSTVWDYLGVEPEERTKTVNDIERAGLRARDNALNKAQSALSDSHRQTQKLQKEISVLAASLGQEVESFFSDGCFPSGSAVMGINEKLLSLPALPRMSVLRSAVDSATALMSVRSSGLEKLKERLLDIMSEMWLDNAELPECLRNVAGVDFLAAAAAANQTIEDLEEDGSDDIDEIATFMVTSAMCIASQLEKNNVRLTESNAQEWEKEMRNLNVMRAKLTTQMVAIRSETAGVCSSLGLDAEGLLSIIREGSVATRAQEAAVELVISAPVSNPPGSQTLLKAVSAIKKTLEGVISDRSLAVAIAIKFELSLTKLLTGEETVEDIKGGNNTAENFISVFASIRTVAGTAKEVKDSLSSQLIALAKQTGGISLEAGDELESSYISTLLRTKLGLSVPSAVSALERDLNDLDTLSANTRDLSLTNAIETTLTCWGDATDIVTEDKSSRVMAMQVMSYRAEKMIPERAALHRFNALNSIQHNLQICVLRAEIRKQLRVSETLHDLQRLDAQLVKHISEMEEFEAASKQDRYEI